MKKNQLLYHFHKSVQNLASLVGKEPMSAKASEFMNWNDIKKTACFIAELASKIQADVAAKKFENRIMQEGDSESNLDALRSFIEEIEIEKRKKGVD